MTKWEKFKDNFQLFTGVTGLIADTIAILGFIGAGVVLPSVSGIGIAKAALDALILLTAILGLYSLTMIVWFLFRRRRSRQKSKTFGFDELCLQSFPGTPATNILFSLIPMFGTFFGILSLNSVRVIFWLGVFIALLPTTLWFYLVSGQASTGCLIGVFGSFFLAQYATFFALVLDKFFESDAL